MSSPTGSAFDRRWITRPRSKKPIPLPSQMVSAIEAQDNAVIFTRPRIQQAMGDEGSTSSTYKQWHTTPLVTLDPQAVFECFDTLDEDVPYSCLHRLNAELVQSGMYFTRDEAEITPTPENQSFIDSVLKPMQFKALQAICAIGVVPIAFRQDEISGMIIPYIPEKKTYTIGVASVRGQLILRLHWIYGQSTRNLVPLEQPGRGPHPNDPLGTQHRPGDRIHGSPDDSVYIISGFNHDPGIDGKICSPVASFLRKMRSHGMFLTTAKIAEIINCNPPMAREYNGGSDEANNEKMRQSEFVGDGIVDPLGKDDADRLNRQYMRNNRQIATHLEIESEIAERVSAISGVPVSNIPVAITTKTHDHRTKAATDAHGNLMPWANEIKVPEQWKLTSVQLPHPRSDLVALLKLFQGQVFMSFLIPSQAIEADSRISADAQSAKETMEIVAAVWREHIGRVLTTANDAVYLRDDMQTAYDEIIRRKKKRSAESSRTDQVKLLVDDNDLEEIMKSYGRVRIHYVKKPKETLETLNQLYSLGIIDWDTYTTRVAQLFGIDASLVAQKDSLPLDARRAIGAPIYLKYLEIIDARTRETNRSKEAEESIALQKRSTEAEIKSNKRANDDDTTEPTESAKPKKGRKANKK